MSVLTVNFMSKCLNRNVTYKAIIPIESSLESDTVPPFKTLYLLHGMLGNCEVGLQIHVLKNWLLIIN
ncbi:MAG: hypothetical protein ACLRQF_21225 [Thomasclavelia ramosa]